MSDIDEQVKKLLAVKVDIGDRTSTDRVKTAMVRDPDGNSIAFAQAIDAALER